MRKWTGLLLLICLKGSVIQAQNGVELFGYLESQIMGAKLKNEFYQLYTNKLRIDLKYSPSDKITFAANYDYITYHGKTEWNIIDFLSPEVAAEIAPGDEILYIFPFGDRNFLDNAYLKIAFKYCDLTLGKQQVSLGSGYVWNPTDLFNIKDPLDPTYEQPGHNAIRLDVPIGSSYTLTALYGPEDTWRRSDKLIQLKGRLFHLDYTIIAVEKIWRFHDYTDFDWTVFNFRELPEKRQLIGMSTEGELLGLGVWAEYGYNRMEISENFYELVVGMNYTFDFQTFIMVEFYRNSMGKTDYNDYNLNDWMRSLVSEQKAISRDQVYGLVQHPVGDFLNLGLSTIYNISDKSYALIPTANYSLSDNVDLMAYLNFNFGKEGKVFSKLQGNGGLLRARVYF